MVSGQHRHGQRGFSLLELLVVLALVGIMVSLAAPAYTDFIANQRARTDAQSLMGALMYARSEAIKRNSNISITPSGGDWAQGWDITGVDAGGLVFTIKTQQALKGITITETGGAADITYTGRGRLTNANNVSFTVCDSNNYATQRLVAVDLSGRPKISKGVKCP